MTKKVKIIIGVIVGLWVATAVALAVPLGIFCSRYAGETNRIESLYEKSYRETIDSLDNAESKLSKVNVVTAGKVKRELLADVWKECDVAVSNLSQIGIDGEQMESVTKFLNQLGDYAYYLMGKIGAGEDLSKSEKDNVKRFYSLLTELKTDLSAVGEGTVKDGKISASTIADLSAVGDAIKNYSSVDYPELIYDGPFSDGLNDRETKFLDGKAEITEETAINKIKELFPEASDVKAMGEGKSTIEAYVIGFKNGEKEYSAFVTKKGGFLASMNCYGDTENPTKTDAECVEKGKAFLEKAGYKNMSEVWVYNNNSTVYINFAYVENGTVFYPDLVKVKVSAETGEVQGLEATNYIYNHAKRDVKLDKSAENTIKISEELTVLSTRYCVIPTDWNEEVFCKEVKGTSDGLTYYVYYDLSTGEEIRALVVIDADGDKLI